MLDKAVPFLAPAFLPHVDCSCRPASPPVNGCRKRAGAEIQERCGRQESRALNKRQEAARGFRNRIWGQVEREAWCAWHTCRRLPALHRAGACTGRRLYTAHGTRARGSRGHIDPAPRVGAAFESGARVGCRLYMPSGQLQGSSNTFQ